MSGCPLNTRTRNRGDRAGTAPLGEGGRPPTPSRLFQDGTGTDARVRRHRRWRDDSPLRLMAWMVNAAWLTSVSAPAPLREARLNGFSGPLAGVLRRRMDGGWRRHSVASPTGLSDAR